MEENKNKKIMEILLMVSISTVLMILGIYYLPLITFLYPIPFVVLGVKYSNKLNIISMIVSVVVIGFFTDKFSGIFILLAFLPLSIALNYAIKERKKPIEIIAISTLVLMVSFFIILSITGDMTGISIVEQLEEFFSEILNVQIELLKESGISNYELFKFIDTMEDKFGEALLIIPSIIMILSLIMAYLNYLISVLILIRLGYGIVYTPKFSKFSLPNNILLGTGIMLLGNFLLKVLKFPHYETIFINITTLISFVFFLQGLAVIDYRLIRKNRNWFLRVLAIIFISSILPLGGAITILGMLDIIFDFRKLKRPV